jgi:hypothetical protein
LLFSLFYKAFFNKKKKLKKKKKEYEMFITILQHAYNKGNPFFSHF